MRRTQERVQVIVGQIVVAQVESVEVRQLFAAGQVGGVRPSFAQMHSQERQNRQPALRVGEKNIGSHRHPVEQTGAPFPVANRSQQGAKPIRLVDPQQVMDLSLQVQAVRTASRQTAGESDSG